MFFHRHNDQDIPKKGVTSALGAFAYVIAVVLLLSNIGRLAESGEDGVLAPVGFLMLLVLSAAVMGLLIFGAPVMLYIDGKKKEAVRMVAWTIGSLAVITVCMLVVGSSLSGL